MKTKQSKQQNETKNKFKIKNKFKKKTRPNKPKTHKKDILAVKEKKRKKTGKYGIDSFRWYSQGNRNPSQVNLGSPPESLESRFRNLTRIQK